MQVRHAVGHEMSSELDEVRKEGRNALSARVRIASRVMSTELMPSSPSCRDGFMLLTATSGTAVKDGNMTFWWRSGTYRGVCGPSPNHHRACR